MTTGKDYELPEQFHDWVEVNHGAIRERQVIVTVSEYVGQSSGRHAQRIFVPPNVDSHE